MEVTGRRLDYIDTTKFLAIFFILIGHCDINSGISQFLYAFHVQLFFIVYGYCHKQKSYNNIEIWARCKKLFNRLVLPYFLLVFILGFGLSIKNFLLAAYGTGWSLYNPDTLHLWFLPCFFLSAIIFEILRAKINFNTDMGGGKFDFYNITDSNYNRIWFFFCLFGLRPGLYDTTWVKSNTFDWFH